MSGGRVEIGLGTGWFEAEHVAYGIAFPPFGERFDRLAEQLEILTGLWSTPEGETLRVQGTPLRAGAGTGAAEAGPAAAPACDRRRSRRAAHAGAGGTLRLRVQRPVRRRGWGARADRGGPRGVSRRRPRPGRARLLTRGDRLLRGGRGGAGAPRRADRPRGRGPAPLRCRRHPAGGRRSAAANTATRARAAPTCR